MVSGKLSKINGILNRLKYIYPVQVLLILYKSLFVPHINYGSLVWGQNCNSINKMQKKAIRTVTHSNYIAHSEPLLKDLNLLSNNNNNDLYSLREKCSYKAHTINDIIRYKYVMTDSNVFAHKSP